MVIVTRPLERGDVVVVTDWQGERLMRRVWSQSGPGVQLCSEAEYKRATSLNCDPLFVGFPLTAIVDVVSQT